MKLTEKEAALEAILFTMGEAVETKRLAEAIGERNWLCRNGAETGNCWENCVQAGKRSAEV